MHSKRLSSISLIADDTHTHTHTRTYVLQVTLKNKNPLVLFLQTVQGNRQVK